jgi:hypothetical protein
MRGDVQIGVERFVESLQALLESGHV